MNEFKVLNWDVNHDSIEEYDVLPYFRNSYLSENNKPKSYEDFREFILIKSLCQYWSRCQYEIIVTGWPIQKHKEKIDVHYQVKMNIDIICNLLWNEFHPKTK